MRILHVVGPPCAGKRTWIRRALRDPALLGGTGPVAACGVAFTPGRPTEAEAFSLAVPPEDGLLLVHWQTAEHHWIARLLRCYPRARHGALILATPPGVILERIREYRPALAADWSRTATIVPGLGGPVTISKVRAFVRWDVRAQVRSLEGLIEIGTIDPARLDVPQRGGPNHAASTSRRQLDRSA